MGKYCAEKSGKKDIIGDGDPLDILVLTEKDIPHGDVLAQAIPIGGFRMLDGNQADDKIISVLKNDVVYGEYKDINDMPEMVIKRLKHYFLTYKDMPGLSNDSEITHVYGAEKPRK